MNNLNNNAGKTPRQLARRKPARGCEPSSLKLSLQLSSLFPTNSDDILAFNDALGTTVGAKKDGKYSPAALTAFGEDLTVHSPTPTQNSNFFTGKPYVEGLGHAFLMRNYRASLAKWQTTDPMGYPDGWNQLAYCNNSATSAVDLWGCEQASGSVSWDWSWHYEWQDIWTGYRLVLRGNTFTVNIDYHIVEAPNHVPVIQVDGIVESFNCPLYKFNIYSEDYISIFGFETNFNGAFTQLVAYKDIVLKGRCRKE